MKPLKSLTNIACWTLRISVLLFMIVLFYPIVKEIDFQSLSLYILIAFLYFLFGVLLFVGGFQKNSSLTIISAIIVFLISIYFLISKYNGTILSETYLVYIFPFSIALYFMANGNN